MDYLQDKWSEREMRNFARAVYDKLRTLELQPKMGTLLNTKRRTYRTLVHKKVSLVYRYRLRRKEIELVVFWNNSQNPRRFRY